MLTTTGQIDSKAAAAAKQSNNAYTERKKVKTGKINGWI